MKRKREESCPTYHLKLRKRHERFSTSAFGCLKKKYPVKASWFNTQNNSIFWKRFSDSYEASLFFGTKYFNIHIAISKRLQIFGCNLEYEKFL